jgi:glycosyltransferase involved in cell wall biosynthesis
MKISYAITVHNEAEELDRLLSMLVSAKDTEDEIVVQMDTTATSEVKFICDKYPIKSINFDLNKDFATFKNNLSKHCTKEYIFQIDADEYPHPDLITNLPSILEHNPAVDVFLVPRINTVQGITNEHIKKWGWNVSEEGWINFPDYQWRIWKNDNKIKWINKVHERLDMFSQFCPLPASSEYCLFHPKDIKRQENQNQFYSTL